MMRGEAPASPRVVSSPGISNGAPELFELGRREQHVERRPELGHHGAVFARGRFVLAQLDPRLHDQQRDEERALVGVAPGHQAVDAALRIALGRRRGGRGVDRQLARGFIVRAGAAAAGRRPGRGGRDCQRLAVTAELARTGPTVALRRRMGGGGDRRRGAERSAAADAIGRAGGGGRRDGAAPPCTSGAVGRERTGAAAAGGRTARRRRDCQRIPLGVVPVAYRDVGSASGGLGAGAPIVSGRRRLVMRRLGRPELALGSPPSPLSSEPFPTIDDYAVPPRPCLWRFLVRWPVGGARRYRPPTACGIFARP